MQFADKRQNSTRQLLQLIEFGGSALSVPARSAARRTESRVGSSAAGDEGFAAVRANERVVNEIGFS